MGESSIRELSCARCGTAFTCARDGECWCAAEPYKMPMATPLTEDCLCRTCLRAAAAALESARHAPR